MFFVISGFLITGIIRRAVEPGTFTLTDFYARRIKRILPALVCVLIACLLAGGAFWLADEWRSLGRHVFAGALFHANIAVANDSTGGYFVALSGRDPLLHLWSLGVEEQFYVVWPLLFAALVRWTRRPQFGVVALLAASMALNLLWVIRAPTDAYFLPFTRLWELLVGAALVFVTRPLRRAEAEVAGTLGLGLILASCVLFDWAVMFPGWRALLPTLGAALVILAGPGAWVGRLILSARPVVWVGLISYPLYLWHWPLLVFGRALWIDARFLPGTLMLVAASFVLAFLTYKIVEHRARSAKGLAMPMGLLVALVAVAMAGRAVANGNVESRLTRIVSV